MPINLRALSVALVLAGLISTPVLAASQTDGSTEVLLRGAKKWADKDRSDLAKNLLNKLLLIDPNSQEALYMLGSMELKSGKTDEARGYLRKLEQTAPDGKRTRELADAIKAKNAPKPAPVERIAAPEPAAKPRIAEQRAAKSAEPKQEKRRTARAQKKPAPQAAPEVPTSSLASNPDIIARTDALDALADGDLVTAETSLLDIQTRRPQDPEVIGGLGLINQKRGKFAEAEQLFTQALAAAQAAKSETGRWESLINTAKFSQVMTRAKSALDENNLPEANAAAGEAMTMRPGDPDAMAVMGNIKFAENNNAEAERLYREALNIEGYNVFASRGLANLLAHSGRGEEAIQFIEKVLQDYPNEWRKSPYNHASLLRTESELFVDAHRPSQAMKALETAVSVDPKNPWVRFSLAKLYISMNLAPMARSIVQEGVALAPNDPAMHQVQALILLNLDDYAGGIDSLNQIPEESLTQDMRDTKNRALMKYYLQQADIKIAQGNRKEAMRIMAMAQTQAQGDYSATEQVAEGWFSLGQQKLGLAAMRKLPQPAPLSTQVRFASMLNRAKKDQELADYLPTLRIPQTEDETSRHYRETIQDIEFAMAGRQYDKLLKAGKKEEAQQFAENILGATPLSSREYFRFHRSYFSNAELPESAIFQLSQEVEQNPDDLNMRWELAYAYYQNKQNANAKRELQSLIGQTKNDDIDMRLRIARLQQNLGDTAGANKTLDDLIERFPNNTEVSLQAGNIARSEGRYNKAMSYYELTRERAAKPAPQDTPPQPGVASSAGTPDIMLNLLPGAQRSSAPKPVQTSTPESEAIYRAALASDVPLARPAGNSDAANAQQAMDSISANRKFRIETALDIESKTASSGTSTYNTIEVPVAVHFPIGYEANGTVQVDRVSVDAGTLPAAFADASAFGKVLITQKPLAQPLPQQANGTSLALGYEGDTFKSDVGMVGQGFPVSNVVGGIRTGGSIGRMSYSLNLSRRPYTGSLISYAGAKDPVTGATWGGVTNTGVSLYMSTTLGTTSFGNFDIAGIASYGLLRGQNVQNNDRLYLRAVIDHDLYTSDDLVLNVGLSMDYMSFSKNEGYYSFGHGAYYSPQSSLSFGLPIELSGRSDMLSYQIRASVSYATTNSNSALYFPTDPAAQAIAAANNSATYQGGPGSGYGYGLRATSEYRAAPEVVLGGKFSMDRSAYYAPNSVLFYLKYLFTPETGPVKLRPDPVLPYSQY